MDNGMRHELKFLISRSAAELLRLRLPHVMKRDSHTGETGQYTIRSLYFDDFSGGAYYEKVDGVSERTKYRIRFYNYDSSVIKLERKEKKGHLTRKTAQTVSYEDVMNLQKDPRKPCPDHPRGLTEELRLQCVGKGTRPVVLVDYVREAYLHPAEEVRITFDKQLRTGMRSIDLFNPNVPTISPFDNNDIILEVKFNRVMPPYIRDLLSTYCPNALSSAISKYTWCRRYEDKEA